MYKIVFKYRDGRKGDCIECGKVKLYDTKAEAQEEAERLNGLIDPILSQYLPTYHAVKVSEKKKSNLVGKEVTVIDKESIYCGEWGIINAVDEDGYFYVAIACGTDSIPMFSMEQIRIKKG